jgi:hypothetical protein
MKRDPKRSKRQATRKSVRATEPQVTRPETQGAPRRSALERWENGGISLS